MDTGSRGQELGIKDEVLKKACSVSVKAHQSPEKPFLVKKIRDSLSQVIFAFSGSWASNEWSAREGQAKDFGETEVDLDLFPSLRSIGNDIRSTVPEASMRRFLQIVEKSQLRIVVEQATKEIKPIIFAGHSSGGPIVIYATISLLEEYHKSKNTLTHGPFCLTFESPLTTDCIFCHGVRREEWAGWFVHFVMINGIAPMILVPLSSTKEFLEQILPHFISTCTHHKADSIDKGPVGWLSQRTPDAVLQLLFNSLQRMSESEVQQTAVSSLLAHLAYEDGLDKSLGMRNAVHLENLRELPLSSDDNADTATKTIDATLNDLNLSVRARLCLCAAGESEKQKEDNQTKIEHKKVTIENALSDLEGYRTMCETCAMGYYDAFKVQKYEDDFKANVKRLELAAIWDEIIELLK